MLCNGRTSATYARSLAERRGGGRAQVGEACRRAGRRKSPLATTRRVPGDYQARVGGGHRPRPRLALFNKAIAHITARAVRGDSVVERDTWDARMQDTFHGLRSDPPTVDTAAFARRIWNASKRDVCKDILRAGFRLRVARDGAVDDGLARRDG